MEDRTIPGELDKIQASISEIKGLFTSQPAPQLPAQVMDKLGSIETSVTQLAAAVGAQTQTLLEAIQRLDGIAVDQAFIAEFRSFMDQGKVAFKTISQYPAKSDSAPAQS